LGDNEQEIDFEFDKFMESIQRNERAAERQQQPLDDKTDARRYIERYRELPQNRTRYQR
jgi:hypothetical protein